jgi:hypothetical protein
MIICAGNQTTEKQHDKIEKTFLRNFSAIFYKKPAEI